jgi:K+-sensing histidine kinase KdpD
LEIVKKKQRGKLKIFLGYAPGVGKTYAMLNEGNRHLKRGQDVVIGYVETHGRKDTKAQIRELMLRLMAEEIDLELYLNVTGLSFRPCLEALL